MTVRDSYKDDPSVPERLREALSQNGKALEFFAAMTEKDRARFCRKAEKLADPAAMSALVDSLVGHEHGHPPCQL